jgi:hypothetical protein
MAGGGPPTPGWYRVGPAGIEYLDDEIAEDAVLIDTDGEHVLAWQGRGRARARWPGGSHVRPP